MTKAEWGRGNTEGGMMGDGMTSEEGRGTKDEGVWNAASGLSEL